MSAVATCAVIVLGGSGARASSTPGAALPSDETPAAADGRGDVLLFVGRGAAARASGRLSLPTLRFEAPDGAVALAPDAGVRTAAVAVDVGAATGLRREDTPLGRWRFDGALQEGPSRPEPGALPAGQARAAELRLAGRGILGFGRASLGTSRRNFDPASGFLLVDGTRSIGADPDAASALRAEIGADLVRERSLGGGRSFTLRLNAFRERADTTFPGEGILATLSPSFDELFTRHHAPAMALLEGRRPEERRITAPFVLLPAASRTDAVELDAELAPRAPAPGEPPPWAAHFKLSFREVRRFEQTAVPGRRRGPIPAPAVDALDSSHLVVAGLRIRATRVTYRFTWLSPEGLPGNRDPVRPHTASHHLEAVTRLGSWLRLNLGLLRVETDDERFARDLASLHSTLGLEWSLAPRWTLTGNLHSLGSSGPGNRAFAQVLGLDAFLKRAVRVPLLPRSVADGELYARVSFQEDARRAAPAAPLLDRHLWGGEAGVRVLF